MNYANKFHNRFSLSQLFRYILISTILFCGIDSALATKNIDSTIEIIINSGGSYTVLENPAAQKDWVKLTDYLDNTPPSQIESNGIELPLNIKIYGIAEANKNIVSYYHTAEFNAEVKLIVNGKGNFTPDISVYDSNNHLVSTPVISTGNDFYEVKYDTRKGKRYRMQIKKPIGASGLYYAVLHVVPI